MQEGECVVFEPDPCSLETHGLGALESLVSVNSQGKVLIPVMNYHQRDVYLEEGTLLGQAELLTSWPMLLDSLRVREHVWTLLMLRW